MNRQISDFLSGTLGFFRSAAGCFVTLALGILRLRVAVAAIRCSVRSRRTDNPGPTGSVALLLACIPVVFLGSLQASVLASDGSLGMRTLVGRAPTSDAAFLGGGIVYLACEFYLGLLFRKPRVGPRRERRLDQARFALIGALTGIVCLVGLAILASNMAYQADLTSVPYIGAAVRFLFILVVLSSGYIADWAIRPFLTVTGRNRVGGIFLPFLLIGIVAADAIYFVAFAPAPKLEGIDCAVVGHQTLVTANFRNDSDEDFQIKPHYVALYEHTDVDDEVPTKGWQRVAAASLADYRTLYTLRAHERQSLVLTFNASRLPVIGGDGSDLCAISHESLTFDLRNLALLGADRPRVQWDPARDVWWNHF